MAFEHDDMDANEAHEEAKVKISIIFQRNQSIAGLVQPTHSSIFAQRPQPDSTEGLRFHCPTLSFNSGNPLLFSTHGTQSTRRLCKFTNLTHFRQVSR